MNHERGVTLVELMVVVVILGILASLAVSSIKSDPTAKTAREVAAFVQQARRNAIAHGPVRSDVATATATKATQRVRIRDAGGTANVIELYDLVEATGSATYSWVPSTWSWMPQKVQVYGVATSANSTGGETLPTALPTNGQVDFYFFPDGTTGTTLNGSGVNGTTIYLQTRTGTKKDKFRIFVMPLSGAPTTTKGW